MIDEPENLVLKRLAALREDMRDGFAALREEQARTNVAFAAMAGTQVTVQRDICIIQRDLAELKDRVTVLIVASGDDHSATRV